jgi:hypothetical protein
MYDKKPWLKFYGDAPACLGMRVIPLIGVFFI